MHGHDLGLQHDVARLLGRRRALVVLSTGLLAACNPFGGGEADLVAKAADGRECLLDTSETEGPFPSDGSNNAHGTLSNVLTESGIVRRDMRLPAGKTGTTAKGTQVDLEISLLNVKGSCAPLAGHAIYVWHCDAEGHYSIYDLPNDSYLRAVAVTDANGKAQLTTVMPGCYPGRYPHMHFEIYASLEKATSYRNKLLTSQLAMPADACTAIYAADPIYAASVKQYASTSIAGDGIFANNTPKQQAQQTPVFAKTGGGYKATVEIGVA